MSSNIENNKKELEKEIEKLKESQLTDDQKEKLDGGFAAPNQDEVVAPFLDINIKCG